MTDTTIAIAALPLNLSPPLPPPLLDVLARSVHRSSQSRATRPFPPWLCTNSATTLSISDPSSSMNAVTGSWWLRPRAQSERRAVAPRDRTICCFGFVLFDRPILLPVCVMQVHTYVVEAEGVGEGHRVVVRPVHQEHRGQLGGL
jgi:hypothetical protein